jgi:CheY-like chemotaxis protein
MSHLSWETFLQQAQVCLTHFYDYGTLHDNPLVKVVASAQSMDIDEVELFREVATDIIERFRPTAPSSITDSYARSSRAYQILMLRYIEQKDIPDLLKHLALSKRQFYRENAKAVAGFARLLWEQLYGNTAHVPSAIGETRSGEESAFSPQSEIERVTSRTQPSGINIWQLLQGLAESVSLLAEKHGVDVSVLTQDRSDVAHLDIDRTVLRQTLFNIVLPLITETGEGTVVHITYGMSTTEKAQQFVFTAAPTHLERADFEALLVKQQALTHLLNHIEARLQITKHGDRLESCVVLPNHDKTILLIDDNPDVFELFRQYLLGQPYRLLTAADGAAAFQMIHNMLPDVIILDIMLAGQDGLEILQILRSQPATQHIPILICSVLNMHDLTFSLGANNYLKKPPDRADFLTALNLAVRSSLR